MQVSIGWSIVTEIIKTNVENKTHINKPLRTSLYFFNDHTYIYFKYIKH